MFKGGKAEVRSVAAHNVHENVGRVQEGGTGLLCYGPLIEQYDCQQSGKDDTGLGRWVVIVFQGADELITRVVCSYNPCYNNKNNPELAINSSTGTSSQRRRTRRAQEGVSAMTW